MSALEQLKHLLQDIFLPDLEIAIDELFAKIDQAKNATKQDKEDLEEMREMRTECFAILEEIERKEMSEEEASMLLEALKDAKKESL